MPDLITRGNVARWAILLVLGSSLAATATAQPTQPAAPGTSLTLEAAIERALSANPTIAAARLRRSVNLAGIAVAGERPNPEIHAEAERETPKQDVGIAVPIELGGKRARRIAVAEATLQVGEAELSQTIIDIRAQVRRAYYARLISDQRLTILDEIQQFATRARDAAQARFDVGGAPRLEVLQGQLALAQAENEAAAARASARAATIQLNALLGFPPDNAITLGSALDASTPVGAEALSRAQAANAELVVLDRQISEQTAKLALAQALRTPDITPDVTFTRDSKPDFMYGWRLAAAVTVPVFASHRAGVQVEQTTLAQLTAQRAALVARINGEVLSAAQTAEAQRLAYLRYQNEILPLAQQVETMAEDSYRLGQTGIAALLQALQASRDVRLRSLQTASDFQDALGQLERAVGAPLP